MCDQYVIIKKGKCLASGSKEELLASTKLGTNSTMEAVYLRLVEQNEMSG